MLRCNSVGSVSLYHGWGQVRAHTSVEFCRVCLTISRVRFGHTSMLHCVPSLGPDFGHCNISPIPHQTSQNIPGGPWWHVTKRPHFDSEQKWTSCHNPGKKRWTSWHSDKTPNFLWGVNVTYLDLSNEGLSVTVLKCHRVEMSHSKLSQWSEYSVDFMCVGMSRGRFMGRHNVKAPCNSLFGSTQLHTGCLCFRLGHSVYFVLT